VTDTLGVHARAVGSYFPEADFAAWLRAIARREALAARRKLQPATVVTDEQIEQHYQRRGLSAPADLARREALAAVPAGPERSDGLRRVRTLLRGPAAGRVGSPQGLSLAAVKQLLYRARMALRQCVRRLLVEESS